MAFTLPDLPYPADSLEPHIDARTMEIHHGKHHAAYVANLNKAIEGHADLAAKSIDDLMRELSKVPEAIRTPVRNNGGGHANHSLFWQLMKKGGGGAPKGELASAIDKKFGGFEKFQEQFANAGVTRFGSGWAWLSVDGKKELQLSSSANQDTPLSDGVSPILGLDVWEHAYYLNYQNRRPDYIKAWWNVVNWDAVAARYAAALKG
jgi:Fe-Mn family superoxide dismutase